MCRVFLAEPANNFNLDGLKEFGEVEYLSANILSPFHIDNMTQVFLDALEKMNFDPIEDHICLTGKAATISILLALIGSNYKEKINLLIYDARTSNYISRPLQIGTRV